jgi:dynein heavy chain
LPVKKIENPNSLDIFKSQEVERFNKLLKIMKKTLADLQKAIKGTVVMSI